jgi:hypothetical protein
MSDLIKRLTRAVEAKLPGVNLVVSKRDGLARAHSAITRYASRSSADAPPFSEDIVGVTQLESKVVERLASCIAARMSALRAITRPGLSVGVDPSFYYSSDGHIAALASRIVASLANEEDLPADKIEI